MLNSAKIEHLDVLYRLIVPTKTQSLRLVKEDRNQIQRLKKPRNFEDSSNSVASSSLPLSSKPKRQMISYLEMGGVLKTKILRKNKMGFERKNHREKEREVMPEKEVFCSRGLIR